MKFKAGKLLPLFALLLGIIAFLMVFLPALKFPNNDTSYTGFQVINGVSIIDGGFLGDAKMPFGILALVAFLLPLIGGLIGAVLPKGYIVSLVFFLVAVVLFFVLPQYTHVNVTILNDVTKHKIDWVLQAGPIIAGGASILGALVSLLGFLNKK